MVELQEQQAAPAPADSDPAAASFIFSHDDFAAAHTAPKRQRRPNVRLGDIGDRPLAATVLEYFLNRTKRGGDRRKNRSASLMAAKHEPADSGLVAGKKKRGLRRDSGTVSLNRLKKAVRASKTPSSRGVSQRNLASAMGDGVISKRFLGKKGRIGIRRHAGKQNSSRRLPRPSNVRMLVYSKGAADDAYGVPKQHSLDGACKDDGGVKDEGMGLIRRIISNVVASSPAAIAGDGRDTETEILKAPLEIEVREWLNSLGLQKYACVFQFHEVDKETLPLLTMDDLKEMEIAAVGARRKMFCEIQKLRQQQLLEIDDLS